MSTRTLLEADPLASTPHHTALILEEVRARTGIDFTQYRAATVGRRIRNRMMTVGAKTLDEYLERVKALPEEAERLAERLTIKVSRFYRNPAVFDVLRHDVLPRVIAERQGPVHVWVAGCGCGEEAYTFAMLLDERGCEGTVEASDIDTFALQAAGQGVYPLAAVQELPTDLSDRYLSCVEHRGVPAYQVRDVLRARVRFHRDDLTSATAPPWPPSAFRVVSCRNVLIYLQRDAQERAFERLSHALGEGGVLVLGEAEWPSTALGRTLMSVKHGSRIFRTVAPGSGDLS